MTWMRWRYIDMKRWFLRNKLGFFIGSILGGLVFYLFWTKSAIIGPEIMRYLIYPLSLLFGCDVPLWSVIPFVLTYGIVGSCIDAFMSKWQIRDDRNRALIILAVLIIIFAAIYIYRDNSNTFCEDINRDGIPDGTTVPVVTATCTDGIKNQDETGVDCGGSCTACPTIPVSGPHIDFDVNIATGG